MKRFVSFGAAAVIFISCFKAAPSLWAFDNTTCFIVLGSAIMCGVEYMIEALTGYEIGLKSE